MSSNVLSGQQKPNYEYIYFPIICHIGAARIMTFLTTLHICLKDVNDLLKNVFCYLFVTYFIIFDQKSQLLKAGINKQS